MMKEMDVVVPQDRELSVFLGFLHVYDEQFVIRVGVKEPFFINVDPKLHTLLSGHEQTVRDRLKSSEGDIDAFMVELKEIAKRSWTNKMSNSVAPSTFYQRLVREIEHIGWKHIAHIDPDLTSIRLVVRDTASREHFLQVTFPNDYPKSTPECIADIPEEFTFRWVPTSCISDVLSRFREVLEKYNDFWIVLEDFDAQTWVIEPEKPTKADRMRRIAIGRQCSVMISIDADNPRRICECRFLGADSIIRPLRERLNQSLNEWDMSLFPRENLQNILGLKFPDKTVSTKEQFALECGICYTASLNGVVTDRVCENEKCGRPFHNSCLFEWLKSNPSARQSFNTVFGQCPYCSDPITATLSTT